MEITYPASIRPETYTSGVLRDRLMRSWPLRRFAVVEDSMRPALVPGDGLLALRGGTARRGQLRVFPDPARPSRWLVKRVGEVYRGEGGPTFEARSDNPNAPGVVDSRRFGPVPTAGSYRVVWTVRGPGPR
jgi:hypothetical protein